MHTLYILIPPLIIIPPPPPPPPPLFSACRAVWRSSAAPRALLKTPRRSKHGMRRVPHAPKTAQEDCTAQAKTGRTERARLRAGSMRLPPSLKNMSRRSSHHGGEAGPQEGRQMQSGGDPRQKQTIKMKKENGTARTHFNIFPLGTLIALLFKIIELNSYVQHKQKTDSGIFRKRF